MSWFNKYTWQVIHGIIVITSHHYLSSSSLLLLSFSPLVPLSTTISTFLKIVIMKTIIIIVFSMLSIRYWHYQSHFVRNTGSRFMIDYRCMSDSQILGLQIVNARTGCGYGSDVFCEAVAHSRQTSESWQLTSHVLTFCTSCFGVLSVSLWLQVRS